MIQSISTAVRERLGFYVYLYVDPRNDEVFYVGKGQGERAICHLYDAKESKKVAKIEEIRAAGLEPRIDILVHGLPSEEAAFRVEAAVIDSIGPDKLTNAVRGWESGKVGRMPLLELEALYAAKPVEVIHPAMLIRINRLYRYGMSDLELYEATRGTWKVGKMKDRAEYALAVFQGVVRAVFKIERWHPARTTDYKVRQFGDSSQEGRSEFTGMPAEPTIQELYLGRCVRSYFRKGLQSPFVYVNCSARE